MKSARIAGLKTLLAFLLLGILLARLDNREALLEAFRQATRNPIWLTFALALFGVCLAAGYLRWRALLDALELRLQTRRSVALYAMGHAGNLLLPSGIGGDFLKAASLARDPSLHRGLALFSLMADRLVGLFWLMGLTLAVSLAHNLFQSDQLLPQLLARVNAIAFVTALALVGMLARRRPGTTTASQRRPAATRHPPPALHRRWLHLFRLLGDTTALLWRHPRTIIRTGVYSLLNHVGQAACAWCLTRAVGVPLPLSLMLAVFVPANLLTSLPITPGGLGLREIAFPLLLAPHGVSAADGMAVSLLFYGVMLSWTLPCAIPWLFPPPTPTVAPNAANPDLAPPA